MLSLNGIMILMAIAACLPASLFGSDQSRSQATIRNALVRRWPLVCQDKQTVSQMTGRVGMHIL